MRPSPRTALLLLLASSGAALANALHPVELDASRPMEEEHSWTFAVGGCLFGFVQFASLVDGPTPGPLVMADPRSVQVWYGPRNIYIDGYSVHTLAAGLAAVVAMGVVATGMLVRRHRRKAALSPKP